mmetsp:Transcript_31825/g.85006  ORF Transcript_31825/g.85006 Transcript_31825/m.85006 type:complete len:575 (-) Transcript_31825:306-2030(-)
MRRSRSRRGRGSTFQRGSRWRRSQSDSRDRDLPLEYLRRPVDEWRARRRHDSRSLSPRHVHRRARSFSLRPRRARGFSDDSRRCEARGDIDFDYDARYDRLRRRRDRVSEEPTYFEEVVSGEFASPRRRVAESVWVAHTDCAKIIGKQGQTLRNIERDTHTKIKVHREDDADPEKTERRVDIVGSPRGREAAVQRLMDLATFCRVADGTVLKEARVAAADPPLSVEVALGDVGRVLGRGGETVNRIEKASGVKIEVDKTTGKLDLFGEKEAQDLGLKLVLEEASFAKAADGTVLKDDRAAKEPAPASEPLRIWVKVHEAGRVIGRGGETVRDIMEKTGADIKVQKGDAKPRTTQREILIFGEPEQQTKAKDMILQLVSWLKDSSQKHVEPPPRQEEESVPEAIAIDAEEETKESPKKRKKVASKTSIGLSVCTKCGGDHRGKDCPHSRQIWSMAVQTGLQMGMSAIGMQQMQMGLQMGAMMRPTMMGATMGAMGARPMFGMLPAQMMAMQGLLKNGEGASSSCESSSEESEAEAAAFSSCSGSADGETGAQTEDKRLDMLQRRFRRLEGQGEGE